MNVDPSVLSGGLSEQSIMTLVMFAFWGVRIVVHICFALAVLTDAGRLSGGREPILVGPAIWFLATLFGGVITAIIYWGMHHSRLNESVPMSRVEQQH